MGPLGRIVMQRGIAVAVLALASLLPATPVAADTGGLIEVSAGADHSCLVTTEADAVCWGSDRDGQVGFGSPASARDPKRVKAGGGYLTGVTAISAGRTHSCALKANGTVWCWGSAEFGQAGGGTTGDANGDQLEPVQVRKGAGFLTGITAITAGGYHTCARRDDGSAWCWGDASFGAVGDGTTGDPTTHLRLTAVRVRQGTGFLAGVTRISAGWAHTCARTSDGSAWCWGFAVDGELGDGTLGGASGFRSKAVRVQQGSGPLTDVRDIEAGEDHTCAVRSDGTAWCWGGAAKGQIGDGTTGGAAQVRLKAVQVRRGSRFLTNVTRISAGEKHSCARRSDGTAWCWGDDFIGQLGDGTTGDPTTHIRTTAVQVLRESGPLTDVRYVTAGALHTCAMLVSQTIQCWGGNTFRQLGIYKADSDAHPYAVSFGEGTVIIP